MTFKKLHNQNDPLLICNVSSAKIAEKLNFQAIGTSSAAIATLLGYEDGENMSLSELIYLNSFEQALNEVVNNQSFNPVF